jgi:hypothetical protein
MSGPLFPRATVFYGAGDDDHFVPGQEDPATVGVGSHFPELRFGRVLTGAGRHWST